MRDTRDHDTSVPTLTSIEVAAALGVSRYRVHQLGRQFGRGRKIGRDILYSEDDLAAFRDRKTTRGPDPQATPDAR